MKLLKCKWCRVDSSRAYVGPTSKMCDPCWELETRIRENPGLAKRMLAAIVKKSK